MERKIIFVFECPYCFALLNKYNAGHRCPNDQAPVRAKREPDSEYILFLEHLQRSDYVFIFKDRQREDLI